MNYHVERFIKPVRNATRDMTGHEKALLDNFRFERSRSPMAEIVRRHIDKARAEQGRKA